MPVSCPPDGNAPSEQLNVVVCAYACNPWRGSEEGVGWGWVNMLAKRHDLHVITAAYHRDDIEQALREQPWPARQARFHYVKERPWHYRPTRAWRLVAGSCLKPVMNLAYQRWLGDAYALAEELHARERFDLVHLVTYVGFRFPGRFWRMDIPFVWGPIGGLENTPWRLLPALGWYGAAYFAGRNVVNSLQKRFLPGPKRAFRKARGGIIAATEEIRREIAHWYGQTSEVICEVGLPPGRADKPPAREPGQPLRLAWSGLHDPAKALPLLLRAAAELPSEIAWELDVLGTGSCTEKWRRLAGRLGIDGRCRWHGWVAREEALRVMQLAHLFVITSLKDLTSTVVVEALAQGLPVVGPDHCGFADTVTDDCGMRLRMDSPGLFQAELARAIVRLEADEPLRRRLAAGALRRSADFAWEKKAKAVDRIYRKVVRCPVRGDSDLEPTNARMADVH